MSTTAVLLLSRCLGCANHPLPSKNCYQASQEYTFHKPSGIIPLTHSKSHGSTHAYSRSPGEPLLPWPLVSKQSHEVQEVPLATLLPLGRCCSEACSGSSSGCGGSARKTKLVLLPWKLWLRATFGAPGSPGRENCRAKDPEVTSCTCKHGQ